jgi:hypothetical protein
VTTTQQRQQAAAAAIATVLSRAASTRSLVLAATGGLSSCTLDAHKADQDLTQALAERTALLAAIPKAQFAVVPHGHGLVLLLHKAWVHSVQADQAFLAWAQDDEAAAACGTKNAHFAKGSSLSKEASSEKTAFAAAWNAYVAGPTGVAAVTEAQL